MKLARSDHHVLWVETPQYLTMTGYTVEIKGIDQITMIKEH